MVIFGDSVKNLKNIFDEVDHFCLEKLALFLKAPVFGKTFRGVPFLGWRITKDRIFLLSKTKRRMKNRLKEIQKAFERGKITEEKALETLEETFKEYEKELPPTICAKQNFITEVFDDKNIMSR